MAADPDEKTLYVLRMSDGELIERRPLPETPWLLTSGRNVANCSTETKAAAAKDAADRGHCFRRKDAISKPIATHASA